MSGGKNYVVFLLPSFFESINTITTIYCELIFLLISKLVVNSFFYLSFHLDIYTIKQKDIKWIFHMKKCQHLKVNIINSKKRKTRLYFFFIKLAPSSSSVLVDGPIHVQQAPVRIRHYFVFSLFSALCLCPATGKK